MIRARVSEIHPIDQRFEWYVKLHLVPEQNKHTTYSFDISLFIDCSDRVLLSDLLYSNVIVKQNT